MSKIAIVGLGAIGERLIPTFQRHEGFVIGKVQDIDTERTKLIATKFGLKASSSFEEILNDTNIDSVYLAVPPKFHADMAIKILRAGKHILCEKPLAATIDEARLMLEETKLHPLVHAMNFPLPYTASFDKLGSILREGGIGELLRIEISGRFPNWPRLWQVNDWIDTREEGGFTREVFTHFVELVIELEGDISIQSKRVDYLEDARRSETSILAIGHTQKGTPILINGISKLGVQEEIKMSLIGSKGMLDMINWRELYLETLDTPKEKLELESIDATYELIDNFYRATLGKDARVVDFGVGYKTVRVVEGMLG